MRGMITSALVAVAGHRAFKLLASGALTADLGIGRRTRPLGPLRWHINADREAVFDVIAEPYLGKTPHALADKLQVWERGSDMVLAAHFTPVSTGVTTTVETVRFTRPERVDFRVVRGPVPHVAESFVLAHAEEGTTLTWQGELGTDLWAAGEAWGRVVARNWERTVRASLDTVAAEAERRARG